MWDVNSSLSWIKIPFSSHRRYFWGNPQALPFYIPFQRVLPHQLTVFADTELFQRNISPTKGLQNSTYHFWMKTRAHVGLREQSILLEAIRRHRKSYTETLIANSDILWCLDSSITYHTFPDCRNVELWSARPKSETFAWSASDIRIFLAARSRWMTFCDSRYSIPLQASLLKRKIYNIEVHLLRFIYNIRAKLCITIFLTYLANLIWSFFVTYCLPLDLRYSSKLPFDMNSVTIFMDRVTSSNTIPSRQTRLSCWSELMDKRKMEHVIKSAKKYVVL